MNRIVSPALCLFALLIPALAESQEFTFAFGAHDAQWRSCRKDTDCMAIINYGVCEFWLPVNSDHAVVASKYASHRTVCFSPTLHGKEMPSSKEVMRVAHCVSDECELYIPESDGNGLDPTPLFPNQGPEKPSSR